MKKVLVVGQGIAGTILALALEKEGLHVTIADGAGEGASSPAAAGVINPVTGRRFVKSWRFEAFFAAAKRCYLELESRWNINIWHDLHIVRLLTSVEDANNWSYRCGLPEYQGFLSESQNAGDWAGLLKPVHAFGYIHQAARVDFPAILWAYRRQMQEKGLFLNEHIPTEQATSLLQQYDYIVFCEGYFGQRNALFPTFPFEITKGEALLLRFRDGSSPHTILKRKISVVPLGDGLFWAGSTNSWTFADTQPSEEGRTFLLEHVDEMIAAPYTITGHLAGIRPTMKTRRPVVSQSTTHYNILMFNGLGTKGALLAPLLAEQLARSIAAGHTELPEELTRLEAD